MKGTEVKNQQTLNDIKTRELLSMLRKIALPIALQSLIGSSLSLIDNLMVGSLGELQLNAVGVSVQIFFVYWMLLYGISGGAATFISQFYGVGDFKNIRRTTGFTLTIAMGIGLLFFIAAEAFPQYILRIFTKFPEVIEEGCSYVRIGAPTFLMLAVTQPFTLGVDGAALATSIARLLEMGLILFVVFGRKNKIAGKLSEFFSYGKDLAKRIYRNALPTTANETLWGLGTSLYVAAFARIGITEGAAIQACNTINNLFSLAAFSIGDAILILIGQKLGEGKLELAYAMSKKIIMVGLIIGLVMGGGVILMGEPILRLFDFTPEGAVYAKKILMVYGATLWLTLYNAMHVTGTLRGGGDTRFAMLTETGTVWLIGVPLAFLTSLYLHWPIYIAVLAVKSEEVVKAMILTKRYLSKKWLKNVIENIAL